jgi:hypothetical protein
VSEYADFLSRQKQAVPFPDVLDEALALGADPIGGLAAEGEM